MGFLNYYMLAQLSENVAVAKIVSSTSKGNQTYDYPEDSTVAKLTVTEVGYYFNYQTVGTTIEELPLVLVLPGT